MILAFILLAPVTVITLYIYFKSAPKHIERRAKTIYDCAVFILSFTACSTLCLYFYLTTGQSADRAWWPVLAALGSLLTFPVFFILAGLLRNFIIFRKSGLK